MLFLGSPMSGPSFQSRVLRHVASSLNEVDLHMKLRIVILEPKANEVDEYTSLSGQLSFVRSRDKEPESILHQAFTGMASSIFGDDNVGGMDRICRCKRYRTAPQQNSSGERHQA